MSVSTGEGGEIDRAYTPVPARTDTQTDVERIAQLEQAIADRDRAILLMGGAAVQTNLTLASLAEKANRESARADRAEKDRDQLAKQLEVDAKTGLKSEEALWTRLAALDVSIAQSRVGEQRAHPTRFTVVFFDYDGLGTINGIVGEVTADRLLGKMGDKVKAIIRPEDTAYRFGGDEGVVLMSDVSVIRQAEREDIMARLDGAGKEAFVEFVAELEAEGRHAEVAELRKIVLSGCSAGVVSFNPRRHGSAREVMGEATVKMHKNKRSRHEAAGLDPAAKSTIPPQSRQRTSDLM